MSNRIAAYPMPDQTGRNWLVTGATHGLGHAVARAAAAAGTYVWITTRSDGLGARVADEVGAAGIVSVDLSDLDSVRGVPVQVPDRIDVLVNNAGTFELRRSVTDAGHERTVATNVLGPFALTNLLADRVTERIVLVASGAHRAGRFDPADPHGRRRRFVGPRAYADSKLGVMLWGLELGRRLRGTGRAVQSVHPGWVASNMPNRSTIQALNDAAMWLSWRVGQSPADAAHTVLHAATAPPDVLPPGSHVLPAGRFHWSGPPTTGPRSRAAADPLLARRFWDFAARETGTDLRS